MAIEVSPVIAKQTPALGLTVAWSDSQFVMIVTDKGLVSCGVVDKALMDRAGAAIAIARGTPENPLVTVEDLLAAKIVDMTSKAESCGVTLGMTGAQALEVLSA